jgi:hypothetical protein
MRRVDLLKMQLMNSKGRFFTAEWKGRIGDMMKYNFKVSAIEGIDDSSITCRIFVPAYKRHYVMTFFVNAKGDCTYIASDKSKFQMSGQQAFSF